MPSGIAVTVAGQNFPSLAAAAAHFGVSLQTAARRMRQGYTPEQAFGLLSRDQRREWPEWRLKPIVTSLGTFRTVDEAAARFGLEPGTVAARLRGGWPPDEAVGVIPHARKPKTIRPVTCDGKTYPNTEALADAFSMNRIAVYKRLRRGWTPEQAVGLAAPPPRFRDENGDSRGRVWRSVEIIDRTAFPAAPIGNYKLYVIRCRLTGGEYIGITIGPLATRFALHRAAARKGVKSRLYNAVRKYGADTFSIELVRDDARNFPELQRQEVEEITRRGTIRGGYNVSPGGSLGTPTEITVGGLTFASRYAAAEYYGVDPTVFNIRVSRLGWTPEQAAEIEQRVKFARRRFVAAGRAFRSLKSAAEHFGIDYKLAHDRIAAKGWTVEQALGVIPPPQTVRYLGIKITAFGQTFQSIAACAAHFEIGAGTLSRRLRAGGEIESAISELRHHPRAGARPKPVEAFGIAFPSMIACAQYYGLSVYSLRNRLRYQRNSLEEAITALKRRPLAELAPARL